VKNIPPLYHWSPSRNRASIREKGLVPGPDMPHNGVPVVCLALDPHTGWRYRSRWPALSWDLWQVNLADTPIFRRRDLDKVVEIRVPRTILPQGLTLLAVRDWKD
jgi:hypothetical protein